MGHKPKINFLGAGAWAPNIMRIIAGHSGVQFGLVCDTDPIKLQALSGFFPEIETTTDPETVLRDPDASALVIATTASSHYELARKALLFGKNLFVEKPLCLDYLQGVELVELAEKKSLILMVGHVFLFNPGILELKRIIQGGELGEVISIHSQRTNLGPVRKDVNSFWDLGTHDLSIFNFLLEKNPIEVSAQGHRWLQSEMEDTVFAHFKYPDNLFASIHTSWLHPNKVREITVVGTQKMATWNDMNLLEPIRIYDRGSNLGPSASDTFGSFQLSTRSGHILIPGVKGEEPLKREIHHFIESLLTNSPPLSDGKFALQILKVLEGVGRCLKGGGGWQALK